MPNKPSVANSKDGGPKPSKQAKIAALAVAAPDGAPPPTKVPCDGRGHQNYVDLIVKTKTRFVLCRRKGMREGVQVYPNCKCPILCSACACTSADFNTGIRSDKVFCQYCAKKWNDHNQAGTLHLLTCSQGDNACDISGRYNRAR